MTREEQVNAVRDGSWRDRVVQDAVTWKWTPYQHKGRIKGVGVDCGGLLYEVYNPYLGPFKAFPDTYPADWALHRDNELYLDFILQYVQEVPNRMRGGFSLFRFGRNFSHAAIWTGSSYIHAWGRNNVGMVKESSPSFFNNGTREKPVKHFDVGSQWLGTFQQ